MAYNPHLKSGEKRKRPKAQYRVENWREYNKSLKKRGKMRAYLPNGNLKEVFFNFPSLGDKQPTLVALFGRVGGAVV